LVIAINNSSPVLLLEHWSSSIKFSEGYYNVKPLPEANNIIFLLNECSLSHLVFSFSAMDDFFFFLIEYSASDSSSLEYKILCFFDHCVGVAKSIPNIAE